MKKPWLALPFVGLPFTLTAACGSSVGAFCDYTNCEAGADATVESGAPDASRDTSPDGPDAATDGGEDAAESGPAACVPTADVAAQPACVTDAAAQRHARGPPA